MSDFFKERLQEALKENTVTALFKAMSCHDFTYQFSDDNHYYYAGMAERAMLENAAKASDKAAEVYALLNSFWNIRIQGVDYYGAVNKMQQDLDALKEKYSE